MLETGIPLSLRTVNWDIIGEYVTPSWFGHLAKFVSAQELDIKNNFHLLKLLRQHDDYIMLQFIEQGYRKKQLSILNHIQMLIHAISLSDITTSDGLMVSQNAFLLLSRNSLREGYEWPPSPPKFSNQQKQLWKTAIQATFVTAIHTATTGNYDHWPDSVYGWISQSVKNGPPSFLRRKIVSTNKQACGG